MPVRILLEGRPGSGKTTVAGRLAELLAERGVEVSGFVTREVRESGRRVGFTIESLDGRKATLAHVDFTGPPRVGKYGVDLDAFEWVALPTLEQSSRRGVVLIDELGKMELASERFRDAVRGLFDAPVDVIATTHVFRDALTDALKRRDDVDRVRVTHGSRGDLPQELADRLSASR